ncbi:MAG: helix-turn-helix domain-containing protein [Zoogloeaceae bacterium]|jgi:DNA-binding transcriptional regulator YdaS (Cro superfamily)|nr:helix-turn-helix domain-containing protein [Zoogloeaceae bacterium]
MEKLRAYINSLSPQQQQGFAERCGTSIGYLRKALSVKPNLSESLCINIERESAGAVTCEELRPDVDWAYLRGSGAAANNETTGSEAAA